MATMCHLLGIDHHTTTPDLQGRPLLLVDGEVIREVLSLFRFLRFIGIALNLLKTKNVDHGERTLFSGDFAGCAL